jgi:hypothetical protein
VLGLYIFLDGWSTCLFINYYCIYQSDLLSKPIMNGEATLLRSDQTGVQNRINVVHCRYVGGLWPRNMAHIYRKKKNRSEETCVRTRSRHDAFCSSFRLPLAAPRSNCPLKLVAPPMAADPIDPCVRDVIHRTLVTTLAQRRRAAT